MVLILFKGAFSDLRLFLMTESPLKMIKMLFISLKKLFSFLKYLNFCSDLLVMQENSKIYEVTNSITNNSNRHITRYSRSKGNQTTTLVSQQNITSEIIQPSSRTYTKCGRENQSQTLFKKKSKLSISLNQQSKVSNSLLLLYAQAEDYPNISQLRC